MKRIIAILLTGCLSVTCAACTTNQEKQQKTKEGGDTLPQQETLEESTEILEESTEVFVEPAEETIGEPGGFVCMAKVDDKVFVDTGETSRMLRCGMMDFSFTSSVEEGEPKENNQTNFGIGYEGQYGMRENRIEISIDDVWHVFAYRENDLKNVTASVNNQTDQSAEWVITNDSEQTLYYGTYYILEMWDDEIDTWSYLSSKREVDATEDVVSYVDSSMCALPKAQEDIAYRVEPGKTCTQELDWEELYGRLESGIYRIVKEVQVEEDGSYEFHTMMAEFEL